MDEWGSDTILMATHSSTTTPPTTTTTTRVLGNNNYGNYKKGQRKGLRGSRVGGEY